MGILQNLSGEAYQIMLELEQEVLHLENGVGIRYLVMLIRESHYPNKAAEKDEYAKAIYRTEGLDNPFSRRRGEKIQGFINRRHRLYEKASQFGHESLNQQQLYYIPW